MANGLVGQITSTSENGKEYCVDIFIYPLTYMAGFFTSSIPYTVVPKLNGLVYRFQDLYIEKLISSLESGYISGMSEDEKALTIEYSKWVTDGKVESEENVVYMALDVAKTKAENDEPINDEVEHITLEDVTGAIDGCN